MNESQYLINRRNIALGIKESPEKKKPVGLKKQTKPIAQHSKKEAARLREYKKIKDEILAESNLCEMHSPVCTKIATGLQHKKRRGVNLLNKKYLIRSCDPCNLYVEQFPLWALEKGLAISVHKKENV
jgi:hypothetical protein